MLLTRGLRRCPLWHWASRDRLEEMQQRGLGEEEPWGCQGTSFQKRRGCEIKGGSRVWQQGVCGDLRGQKEQEQWKEVRWSVDSSLLKFGRGGRSKMAGAGDWTGAT